MSRARQLWSLTVLCAAVGLVTVTLTSLYTAGPSLARAIGASQTDLTWITDAYTVALAGLLLPAGALGDRFGRRGVMIGGLGLFVVAAVVLQFVHTPTGLVIDRATLGLAGAFILPATLSLITSTFPEDRRDKAVGIWTASFTLGGGVGILLTAILLQFFSWRSSFWIVLLGGVVILVAAFTVPTSRDQDPPPLDPLGSALAALAITALVFALIDAGLKGWGSPLIIGLAASGLALASLFVVTQLRRPDPLLDVRLFAIRPFGVSAFAVMAVFAAIYGFFFMAMQYEQVVLGFSALKASLPIASMGLTIIPISLKSGWVTQRFGLRSVISVGCLLSAGTFVAFLADGVHTAYWIVFLACVPIGAGTGLNMAPCTSAIINNVSAEKQGVAAAVNHTTREIGTALGVALLGGVLTAGYRGRIAGATAHLPPAVRDASRESVAEALAVAEHLGPAGRPLAASARSAFVGGIHETSAVMLGVMFAVAVMTALWAPRRQRHLSRPDTSQRRRAGVLDLARIIGPFAVAPAGPPPSTGVLASRATARPVAVPLRTKSRSTGLATPARVPLPQTSSPAREQAPGPRPNEIVAARASSAPITSATPALGQRTASRVRDPVSSPSDRESSPPWLRVFTAVYTLALCVAVMKALRRSRGRR